jgi:two-component system OmpR family sensor kinase
MTALPDASKAQADHRGGAFARLRLPDWLSPLQRRSIRLRLSGAFLMFLLLALTLGLFSIVELRNVNAVSADIRDRWLQSVRVLGDLNNFSSDYRAAEASSLLSSTPTQKAGTDRELADLDAYVIKAQSEYERIPHDPAEWRLYRKFSAAWSDYKVVAGEVIRLSKTERSAEGAQLYMTQSRRAYDAASDALGFLTSLTVANAHDASNRAEATYKTARALILMAIAFAGLILVAAINYITRAISNPLLHLAARMRSLASNHTNIEIEGAERRDEIGEMARAVVVFRNNAIELAHSQRGLVQQATMLEERLEAERQLTALQRNFVSMASHEFRTPLTIIDGHAQRLINLKERAGPQDVAERAGSIRRAVQRMTQVMEGLLNASRLFDGEARLYYHPEEFELRELLREVMRVHRESSPSAQIVETLAGPPLNVVGDRGLLFQAFSNLVSNAVKYTPQGGLIELGLTPEDGWVDVEVSDQGLGIPAEDLGRIFERYHRGANVTGIAGTGIGLYFVKTVVDLHGGEVRVESAEGAGARFTLRLPVLGTSPRRA